MRIKKFMAMAIIGVMAVSSLAGCGSKGESKGTESSKTSGESDNVLRVGMECAYAPFNWTQDTDTTPDGSKAVPIYDSNYYAYGYDVAVAQKLADELGMDVVTIEEVTIDKLPHSYGDEWYTDNDTHWQVCECGHKSDAACHNFKWVVDTEATREQPGIRHEECTACGFVQNENSEYERDVLFKGETVIRIEEACVDTSINLLTLSALASAKLRKGFTDLETIVIILVAVRVRNNVISIGSSEVDSRACKINLEYMHLTRHILPLIRSELKTRCKFLSCCLIHLII